MTTVALLGATGSIGKNTLDVVARLEFKVVAMSAGSNIELFAEQIERYQPELVSISDAKYAEVLANSLKVRLKKLPEIVHGTAGLCAVATHPAAKIVVSATVGALGLLPTLMAIRSGKRVCIANKEPLVMAGELMTLEAAKHGAEILPIDSEHNALHQCLRGENKREVRKLILTASGGPFFLTPAEELAKVSVAQALKHPTWQMGRKITIDSATMMNKGLEVIEARWLFGFAADQIDILIHPQSIVHSLIELIDGSVIAQMGKTDMRLPIQYALTYPERLPLNLPRLDLASIGRLEFYSPPSDRFPAIQLAYRALRLGGLAPAVLNAANEVAVEAFLEERIKFTDIAEVVKVALDRIETYGVGRVESVEQVLEEDKATRYFCNEYIRTRIR
ncbi:MAG: 1-deoxy-D-xylulose-5-phosphate reductoisomerase [Acidobacteriota bacterium]|nr:1-deoxy-D-xylulose-5-phosphate reductoisomerase [Blastocatellia bacterium]MDW8413439.1 1-deoxy-D-xylulose-5-phosphate reductoisomerase [Acidobacteriota bacterium]